MEARRRPQNSQSAAYETIWLVTRSSPDQLSNHSTRPNPKYATQCEFNGESNLRSPSCVLDVPYP